MKGIWHLLCFTGLSMAIGLHADISSEKLKKDYSLVLRIRDRDRNYHVAIIPGAFLDETCEMSLPITSFQYEGALWDEVVEMWTDFSRPEDVGCYTIKSLCKMVEGSDCFFELHLPIYQDEGNSDKKVCKIRVDSSVCVKSALLLLNDFIDECHLDRHRKIVIEETKAVPLSSFIDELDEKEIRDSLAQRSKPSAVSNYAVNVGTLFLLKCIVVKESVFSWLSRAKELIRFCS